MYREDDFLAHRDRMSDELIRQLLDGDAEGCEDGCGAFQRREEMGSCNQSERKSWGLHGYPLAMVYSPVQHWQGLYDGEMGLSRGTIFKELDLPFKGSWNDEGGSCRGMCGGMRNG